MNPQPVCEGPVLISGATGFLAGHLIQQLLLRGYKVRATVRDIARPEKFAYLSRLVNAAENLQLVQLDLRDESPASWDAAFAGVEVAVHCAAPVGIAPENSPEEEFIVPIVQGTERFMSAALRSGSVRKVLLTSCMGDDFTPSRRYSEDDWNTTANPTRSVYNYSKTLAERAAYSALENSPLQLISILPGTMWGPHLGGRLNFSHKFLLQFMQQGRARGVPDLSYAITDVRDAAQCHIAAIESNSAAGRYILANPSLPLARILQVSDLAVRVATRSMPPELKAFILDRLGKPPLFSRARAKQLGVALRSPTETVVDTCRFFIEGDHISLSTSGPAMCLIL